MLFTREAEMTAPAQVWLEKQGLMVRQERPFSWGICDLVGLSFSKENVERRIRDRQMSAIGPKRRIRVLLAVTEEVGTAEQIAHRFDGSLDHGTVVEELRILEARRLISQNGRGIYRTSYGWAPLFERIVSVELKLNRVSEAVFQARQNLVFASESYVGLPEDVASRVLASKRKEQFVESGVGLLAVGKSECRVVLSCGRSIVEPDQVLITSVIESYWSMSRKDKAA